MPFLARSAQPVHPLGNFGTEAIDGAGHPAAHRLAEHEQIAQRAISGAIAPIPGADCVRFVPNQQRAMARASFAQRFQIARLGQDHADIGHRRFGQHAGHIAFGQRRFERSQIVEFDHHGVLAQIVNLPDQATPQFRHAITQIDKHIIDRAVIAAVEHQHLVAPGDPPAPADHRTVGLAGARRDLPERQFEACRQFIRHHHRIFGGQHESQPARGLPRDCRGDRGGRMAEHRSGVAQAEIVIAVAVCIPQLCPLRTVGKQRAGRAPIEHPVERDTPMPVARGRLGQGGGPGV